MTNADTDNQELTRLRVSSVHRSAQNSHLPGAINPPYEFVDKAESFLPNKDADISFPKHKTSYLWVSRLSDR